MVQNDNFMIKNDIGPIGTVSGAHLRSLKEVRRDQVEEKVRKTRNHRLQNMAHIFQEMCPGMVTMASTDKNILICDVLGLKTGIFIYKLVYGQKCQFLTSELQGTYVPTGTFVLYALI